MKEPFEVYYEIQWLVPAKNSISGSAYWTAIDLQSENTKGVQRQFVEQCWEKAKRAYEPDEIRLVKFECTQLDDDIQIAF